MRTIPIMKIFFTFLSLVVVLSLSITADSNIISNTDKERDSVPVTSHTGKENGDPLQLILKQIKDLNQKFNNLDQKFENLAGVVNSSKKSQELARLCAVAITIDPKSDLGNDQACGSLVNINNKKYVLTNRHVVIDHKKQKPECARQIPSVTRAFDNHPVPIIRDETLYAKNIDLAIIPVDENSLNESSSSYQWTFCDVTTEKSLPALHDELFGISPRPDEVRAVYGRVLASSISESLVYGDFQGTHGFSGTGYFLDSKLVAVHKGAGGFSHVGDPQDAEATSTFKHTPSTEKEFKRNFSNVIKNGSEASDDDISNVADTMLELMKLHGRNPEAKAVRAFHVHTDVNLPLSEMKPCDSTERTTAVLGQEQEQGRAQWFMDNLPWGN